MLFSPLAGMVLNKRIGMVGAGMMAEAMVKGWLAKKVASEICVCDISQEKMELFRKLGCKPQPSNTDVCIKVYFFNCF